MRPAVIPLLLLLTLSVGLLALPACGGRGDAAFGATCGTDQDCAHGLCVAGVHADGPVCTKSCGGNADCPAHWSCSGVTQANVLVCSHGAATPFGDGTR
ncbi:MAG: hypothetical protein GXP55_13295 [Deltaproteobacteria bacterium]|nr:hypothetical protein [Deltaproteobacteria bacterium]